MKKNFLFVMAAAAMLASCSKDAAVSEPAGNGNENGVVDPTDPNSPVLVRLGAGGLGVDVTPTRGVVDSWNNTVVGIYALAKDADFTEWQAGDGSILLENEKGTITGNPDGSVTKEAINIAEKYYPGSNDIHYTFYGYYPYAAADAEGNDKTPPTNATGKVTKTFVINGSQDIMWGNAVAAKINNTAGGEQLDGYNALYFRKGEGAATPDITFNHKLTQLNFKIKKAGEFSTAGPDKQLSVTKIEINTFPSLDLTIADKAETDNGKIAPTDAMGGAADIPVIKNDAGEAADAVIVDNIDGESAFGTSMMVYTAGETQTTYSAKVYLKMGADGEEVSSPITIKLAEDAAFEAGKSYNVNIAVNSMMKVEVNATLTKWQPGDDAEDIEIN
ncbi:fimbrillin family protein [Phocaeicola plebeius]|uniref:fimbrillin family protein n=1 Tax=Phocaeicola plebeius TaxID=310297 RepID=UPI0026EDFE37|nr:fimbrillin family protein [Phocaeicola plebeius]